MILSDNETRGFLAAGMDHNLKASNQMHRFLF